MSLIAFPQPIGRERFVASPQPPGQGPGRASGRDDSREPAVNPPQSPLILHLSTGRRGRPAGLRRNHASVAAMISSQLFMPTGTLILPSTILGYIVFVHWIFRGK